MAVQGDASSFALREKFDAEGRYLKFPGVSILCDVLDASEAPFAEIPSLVQKYPTLARCYSPLPAKSYHMTVQNIHCQYPLGLDDAGWLEHLQGPQWALCAEEVVAADFVPAFRFKRVRWHSYNSDAPWIGIEVEPLPDAGAGQCGELMGDFAEAGRWCETLQIPREGSNWWHITLAYCVLPAEVAAAEPDQLKAEQRSFEEELLKLLAPVQQRLPLAAARLCRFEDMLAFIPWDGKSPL
eukprot:TRINITY_DN16168_c0_g5_i1.p1 TRINITY_DN16168_c0_g5~~TRINITY_DN16168_c0_g5_i1.p1  ORF type:complete len:240 (-),score=49.30 TRINITY_DN16168_c0_g5_i1:19-738(-)